MGILPVRWPEAPSLPDTGIDLAWEVTKLSARQTRIMDALLWKSPRMPLAYNRNLAAEAGAVGRLMERLK